MLNDEDENNYDADKYHMMNNLGTEGWKREGHPSGGQHPGGRTRKPFRRPEQWD